MKTRAIQFSPKLGDLAANLTEHQRKIEQAVAAGIELIVFPELSLTGYQIKDLIYDLDLRLESPAIQQLVEWSRQIDIVVGLPLERQHGIWTNSALYLHNGTILHRHDKTQLPNYGMFEEAMIFAGGDRFQAFTCRGLKIGLLICREIIFPMHSYLYFLQDCDLIIGISNSPQRNLGPTGFASWKLWETMGYVIGQFHHLHYLFVNRCGFEDGIGFGGGSFHVNPGGAVACQAPYIGPADFDTTIDVAEVRQARLTANYRRDEHPHTMLRELQRILGERP